ncbi:MAG TPA: PEP-CTERM sorting domain-containing protein [Candidatus Acidoferrales bacterium]
MSFSVSCRLPGSYRQTDGPARWLCSEPDQFDATTSGFNSILARGDIDCPAQLPPLAIRSLVVYYPRQNRFVSGLTQILIVRIFMTPSSKVLCAALFCVSMCFWLPTTAEAQTLFSNFGPGQSYDAGTSYVVGVVDEGVSSVLGIPFVPSETANLLDVMAPLNSEGSVNFYVESDSGSGPGSILDALTTTETIGISPSILTYTCSSCTELTVGNTYYLVAVSPGGLYSGWNLSNSDFGPDYVNGVGSATGPWTLAESATDPLPAFEVDGTPLTPTPEPSSFALTLLGIGGVLVMLKRVS